jgi:hypothetical protein
MGHASRPSVALFHSVQTMIVRCSGLQAPFLHWNSFAWSGDWNADSVDGTRRGERLSVSRCVSTIMHAFLHGSSSAWSGDWNANSVDETRRGERLSVSRCVSTIMHDHATGTHRRRRPARSTGRGVRSRKETVRVAVAQDRRRRPASPATAITASTPGAGTAPTSMDWLATLSYAQSTSVTRRVGPSSVKRIQP